MKKNVLLLITIAFCLLLCSCGEEKISENDVKVQAEEETFAAACSMLEAGEYDQAIEAFSSIDSYKKVAHKIEEAQEKKAEAERMEAKAAEADRPREIIDINLSNWETYFELVECPMSTAFGDLKQNNFIFRIKSTYESKVDYDSEFLIDISHVDYYKGESYYEYNSENNSLTLTKMKFKDNNELHNTCSIDNYRFKQETSFDYTKYDEPNPCTIYSSSVFGDVVQVYEVRIDKIKGSIVLFK